MSFKLEEENLSLGAEMEQDIHNRDEANTHIDDLSTALEQVRLSYTVCKDQMLDKRRARNDGPSFQWKTITPGSSK